MYPQRAKSPLQGLDRCALTVGTILGPHCHTGALHWPFHQLWIYMISKKHSGEADQSTLANGDSEYA